RDPVHEGLAEAVAEAAADDDRLQVEQVLGVGHRDPQGLDGVVDQPLGHLVLAFQGGRDHTAGQAIAASVGHDLEELGLEPLLGLPAPGRGLYAAASGVSLEAAAAAARALAAAR